MVDHIFEFVLAVILIVLTRYVVPVLDAYLKNKEADNLTKTILEFVRAAEQIFTAPKSGDQKLEYVQDMLIEKGVEITDEVRAKVEAAVYSLAGSDKK